MRSHYDVFGVGVDANLEEVRQAYYRKARLLHPDRLTGASAAEQHRAGAEMKAVNSAATGIAVVVQADNPSPRWNSTAVTELRSSAINGGMTAPQADCFVRAVTSRYGPSDDIDWALVQQFADACR